MCGLLVVVAGLLAGTDGAQAPGNARVIVTEKRSFILPIMISENARPAIKSVRLFVSTDLGATWKLEEEVTGDGTQFRYQAAAEGIYWFSIQTINKLGKATPSDVSKEPPGLKVHVVRKRIPVSDNMRQQKWLRPTAASVRRPSSARGATTPPTVPLTIILSVGKLKDAAHSVIVELAMSQDVAANQDLVMWGGERQRQDRQVWQSEVLSRITGRVQENQANGVL